MDDVHLSGSNANCLPTDTTKNTVYAFAQGVRHRVGRGLRHPPGPALRRPAGPDPPGPDPDRGVRLGADPDPGQLPRFIGSEEVGHSFVRTGQETRTTEVAYDGERWQVVSGLKDLVVMNSTDSEFWGFVKDQYTTLKEAYDRILATEVTARWRLQLDRRRAARPELGRAPTPHVRRHLLEAFADTYSLSLQQTPVRDGHRGS